MASCRYCQSEPRMWGGWGWGGVEILPSESIHTTKATCCACQKLERWGEGGETGKWDGRWEKVEIKKKIKNKNVKERGKVRALCCITSLYKQMCLRSPDTCILNSRRSNNLITSEFPCTGYAVMETSLTRCLDPKKKVESGLTLDKETMSTTSSSRRCWFNPKSCNRFSAVADSFVVLC